MFKQSIRLVCLATGTPLLLALLLMLPTHAATLQDPIGVVHSVSFDARGEIDVPYVQTVASGGFRVAPGGDPQAPSPDTAEATGSDELDVDAKVHPLLLEQRFKTPGAQLDVIVTLRDDRPTPRFPLAAPGPYSRERDALIDELHAERRRSQRDFLRTAGGYGIRLKPKRHFWIGNSVLATTSVADALALADLPEVQYVQPRFGGEAPPNSNPNDDVIDGRAKIQSDPMVDFFNAVFFKPGSAYCLLDSGVLTRDGIIASHDLLNPPTHFNFLRDCVHGGALCVDTGHPDYDPSDTADHGTSTAAILVGDNSYGPDLRGVTDRTLHSLKVYRNEDEGGALDTAAALEGIQASLSLGCEVIVYQIQSYETEWGAISTAADNAFEAGAINVAAAGNYGPGAESVAAPARAHKVLGVGAYNVESVSENVKSFSGRGPTGDGRTKPEITAPTDTETASAFGESYTVVFTGTSGATPYGAAAVMLLRDWLDLFGTQDPGHAYAFALLHGENAYPVFDNDEGVGPIRASGCGLVAWGKEVVPGMDGAEMDIPLNAPGGERIRTDFEATLWWPEDVTAFNLDPHHVIELELVSPSGDVAGSYSELDVFQRASAPGKLEPGTWTLRIRARDMQGEDQVVYWASRMGC